MNKSPSFNIKFCLYILIYHFFVLFFLFFLLYNGKINFDLIFDYKILFNVFGFKSVFYYLYGSYGFYGIIGAHFIAMIYIVIALFYDRPVSKKIIFIHFLLPLWSATLAYLFFEKSFMSFGFFGEIIGGSLIKYAFTWTKTIFYLFSALLFIFILQLKNIYFLLKGVYYIFYKMRVINAIKYLFNCFFSWLIFFIPFLKKYINTKNYINIEHLINRSIYVDFYNLSNYTLEKKIFNENDNVLEFLLPYEIITQKNSPKQYKSLIDESELNLLFDALRHFNIDFIFIDSKVGPLLNTVILTPDKDIKLIKINAIVTDLARIIGKPDMRVIYPLKDYPHSVALEYSHLRCCILNFMDYAYDDFFLSSDSLVLLLGVDTYGYPYYIDISKAPHILLAGTTGSGKSNILNLLITGLVWKNDISKINLVLIDPKKSEFFLFSTLPHLLLPIAQLIEDIDNVINSVLAIMDQRYDIFSKNNCKNINEYNKKFEIMSYIIVVIDEYADIVLQSKQIELKIIRLLQMSRAAGIHVIVATQRPSADIISSIVKSNLPMKIACKVATALNSRIILDIDGAEKLLGNSDMIIYFNNKYQRLHGLFIETEAIELIVGCFKK